MSDHERLPDDVTSEELGRQMFDLTAELYPICRSITGEGFRQTQRILQQHVPELQIKSVPSGTQCFDWTVPKEWNITDAYVRGPDGNKVIDFAASNLHVVNYSVPIQRTMPLAELKEHLHTMPEQPHLIPYRTSYYQEAWGFCLTHQAYEALEDGMYEVCIDSTLEDGCLNYGECLLPGETSDEVLISTHACHPSLCNDNLSGVVVATFLAKQLRRRDMRYSYRFVFVPGGIGSVVWMSQNQDGFDRIKHGLVLACIGDAGALTYKRTRRGNAIIDQAAENVLRNRGVEFNVTDFSPYGFDERNYNSPKFNLPVGSLSRSTHSEFDGYHSSGDNLDLVRPDRLAEAVQAALEIVDVLEHDRRYVNLIPEAEPQLGKRGLYGMMGGLQDRAEIELALLWVMNFSDGDHSLLDISDRSGHRFDVIRRAAEILFEHGLLEAYPTTF